MADVNPFVIPIPQKWARDPELKDTVLYLWRFLHDLWVRTGGGDDAISELESQSDEGLASSIESRVARLESLAEALAREAGSDTKASGLEAAFEDFSRESDILSRVSDLEGVIEGIIRETPIQKPDQAIDTDLQNTLIYELIERVKAIEAQL